ncbi:hypothetical protein GIB67_040265 [Kingdonia uniflora]|uniref:Uncharacterized protein n=1 Tax=Kingdonia uniflora TaxID=39325 RepID=A0A7J7MUZ4_9MAGN|nr:hypothetical protein GIB67_040265 [Kingdonia uniflora]
MGKLQISLRSISAQAGWKNILGEEAELRRSALLKLYYNRLLNHSPASVTGFVIDSWVRTALQQEAYEDFKHVLLALIYGKDDQTSPVANEVARLFNEAAQISADDVDVHIVFGVL